MAPRLYPNDGRGRFANPQQPRLPPFASWATALVSADGDGDTDLFVAGQGPQPVPFSGTAEPVQ